MSTTILLCYWWIEIS